MSEQPPGSGERQNADPPEWGTAVVPVTAAGRKVFAYAPRPRRVMDLFRPADWGSEVYLVRGGQRWTFAEFDAAVDVLAAELVARGAGRGRRVLLVAHNSPEWVLALWAVWRAGSVPVPGNRWWSAADLRHAVDLLDPAVVVHDLAPGAVPTASVVLTMSEVATAWNRIAAPVHTDERETRGEHDGHEDDEALVLFTSGSTGLPKAVSLSQRAIVANLHHAIAHAGGPVAGSRPPVLLMALPLFHVGGVSSVVGSIVRGARLVFTQGRFDPGEVLALIEREQVTSWGAVPTMASRVLAHPDIAQRDLSSVTSFATGGAPVPPSLLDDVRRLLPGATAGMSVGWGSTESGGYLTVATGSELVDHPGSVGRPFPTVELRIDSPDPGIDGEVLARSPTVMLRYVGEPPGAVDADGWLRTGDVGHLADGHLHLTGRLKDIVIRGGEKVACPKVEHVLMSHPRVVEAAVLGVPDPDLGERVAAVVVVAPPVPGADPGGEVDARLLAGWARERLAHFEVPVTWEIIGTPLPTLPTGKVDKRSLQALFAPPND